MQLKTVLLCCCLVSGFMHAGAQISKFNCDTGRYAVFRKLKGAEIKVECDTVYLLNKFTFNIMYNAYNDYRNQNLLLNQYTMMNDSLSGMYEAQLDTQKLYFDTLNTYFEKLSESADLLVKKSTTHVDSISGNLTEIELQIKSAKDNITNAQTNIKEAKKQIRRDRWKWGVVGFGSGVVLVLLATLIL